MSAMQRLTVVVLFSVALTAGWQHAWGQRSNSSAAGTVGRFQFEVREATGDVFLLDSTTGQVWTTAGIEQGRLLNRLPLPSPVN